MVLEKLTRDIKSKKELSSLDDTFLKGIINLYLQQHPLQLKQNLTEKQIVRVKVYKTAIKEIRRTLREIYGVFKEKDFEKRKLLLKKIKGLNDLEGHAKILMLHKSTKERLPYYSEVYENIFKITGRPKLILDLGCGLNPFSFPWMKLKGVFYIANELTKEDTEFVQEYFNRFGINGYSFQLDLTKIGKLPEADVCFLFKMLDTLETLKKDVSKEIMEKVKAKFIVVSFPTKSLGAKRTIRTERLGWFEKIIENYYYKTFEIENEKFYVIRQI